MMAISFGTQCMNKILNSDRQMAMLDTTVTTSLQVICWMQEANAASRSVILDILLFAYGSGHETAAVLLPGFAINW